MSNDQSRILVEGWMEYVNRQLERMERLYDEFRSDQTKIHKTITELQILTRDLENKCVEFNNLPAIVSQPSEMAELKKLVENLSTEVKNSPKTGGESKGDKISKWYKIPDWMKLLLFFIAGGAIGMGPEAFKSLLTFLTSLIKTFGG